MVEVEELGARCSNIECSEIQFLPFECFKCGKKFCIEHVDSGKHICDNECKDLVQNDNSERGFGEKEKVSVNCTMERCFKVGITCRKCNKILCSEHIYESEHMCVGKNRVITSKSALYLKRRYSGGEMLSGSKLPEESNSSKILRKIMIKSKSIGNSSIPVRNRIAVALYVSRDVECLKYVNKELPICIWLNGEKTVGWNLDYISEKLRVLHGNCKANFSGLVLFKSMDIHGKEIPEKKVLEISVELRRCVSDGESLLLDYGFV
ncbi:AN1-type zinc finger 1-like [Cryptosporidium sp. chipmunk genotype I]|uniref:AN1-type zinc finger 1-like n=1 Tax=Cryptosporidium sp. chipmunk genotype I TaxID=1280935 RepID=UPI00351A41D7|nr:AN1-type zinc finger 1-like [Cryptosporidium sp. chipmunk genotype I]